MRDNKQRSREAANIRKEENKMVKQNQTFTISSLNGMFLNTENNKINEGYLLENIKMVVDNDYETYKAVRENRRRPIKSIVWQGFMKLATELVNDDYGDGYFAASSHLKKWLNTYGRGYDTLADLIAELKDEREEALKAA